MTITKSSQHHAFVKYTLKPSANHLINISKKNITVNILSIQYKISCSMGLCGRCTSSKACFRIDSFRWCFVVSGAVVGGGGKLSYLVKEMHYKYIYTIRSRSGLRSQIIVYGKQYGNQVSGPVLWAYYAYYSVQYYMFFFFFCLFINIIIVWFQCVLYTLRKKKGNFVELLVCVFFSSLTDKSKSNAIKEKFSKKLKTKFLK